MKCWAGWIISLNQDFWEKYQKPQTRRWHQFNGRKRRGTKEPLDEGGRGKWKSWLKFNIQKTKIMASINILHGKQKGKKWKQWQTLFSWAPKSLQTVTAVMKLKDACSLEEKLWQTQRAYWKAETGTSLMVQWLRLWAPNAGGLGLIPGQGTRSHMSHLRPDAAK